MTREEVRQIIMQGIEEAFTPTGLIHPSMSGKAERLIITTFNGMVKREVTKIWGDLVNREEFIDSVVERINRKRIETK